MFWRSTLPLLIAPALLVTACGPRNGGLESVHQPVVERTDYVFDVQTGGYGLPDAEQARLAGWIASLDLRYGDFVYVDDPHNAGIRAPVAALVERYGLLIAPTGPVTQGEIVPGTARVVIRRMRASVPSCPDFRRDRGPEFSASTSSNFGCATNSSLAAMVANPQDLVRGQPGATLTDPATATRAIKARRDAAPSGGGGAATGGGGASAGGSSGGGN